MFIEECDEVGGRLPSMSEVCELLQAALSRLDAIPRRRLSSHACYADFCRLIAQGQALERCVGAMNPASPHYCRKARKLYAREVLRYLSSVRDFLDRNQEEPEEGFGAFLLSSSHERKGR